MAFDVLLGQRPGMLKSQVTILFTQAAIKIGIRGVEQKIQLTVAIPIDNGNLASSASAADPFVESQRFDRQRR